MPNSKLLYKSLPTIPFSINLCHLAIPTASTFNSTYLKTKQIKLPNQRIKLPSI